MRCPDCNKFVGFDELRIDDVEVEIDGDRLVMKGQAVLPCAECSTDLKGFEAEAEEDIADQFPALPPELDGEDIEVEYEIQDTDTQGGERSQTVDRKGKAIGNPRYWKRFYLVESTVTVGRTVKRKGETVFEDTKDFTLSAEEQASNMEELV